MRTRLWIAALVVLLGSGAVPTATTSQTSEEAGSMYVPVTRFDPSRNAARDIADAVREGQRSGRRVLMDVGGDWCIWCHRLDTLFSKHAELAAMLHENFVVVKVNYSKENKNEEMLSHFPEIPGYPHLFVLDQSGGLLHSQDTGELESGKGHDPEKVRAFIQAWGSPLKIPTAGHELL